MKRLATLGVLALGLIPAPLSGQDPKSVAADPAIELPRFVVTDSRELPQPESWRYATIPGFEILTNASDAATQRLVRDFAMFRQALGYVWPVQDRVAQHTSLILCGKGGKFDAFVPAGKTMSENGTASLFLRQGVHAAIIIDLQATTLNVFAIDASLGSSATDPGRISVEHDKQLYREYVRYLMSQSEARPPAWLQEGLSQIIMRMQFDKRYIEFAKLEDQNAVSVQSAQRMQLDALNAWAGVTMAPGEVPPPGAPAEDRDFPAALRGRGLVPFEQFFAIGHDAPEATNPLGNNIWAKQAYAFVHMCLYGHRGKFQKPFAQFVQRTAKEPLTEAVFKACFGQTYKEMLMEIRSYADAAIYEARIMERKKGEPDLITVPPPLALREATQSEVGRIKGEALQLAGHSKLARSELIAPYLRGERDPNLLAALGVFEKKAGEHERARKLLEAALAGKSTQADALVEVARYRYADALAKPDDEGRFSQRQVSAILEPLHLARKQPPPMPATYELAAEALARSAVKPTPDEARLVIEGAVLFQTRLKLVHFAVQFAAQMGDLRSAHALTDYGIRYAPEPNGKKAFEQLKASLPPAPPSPDQEGAPAATKKK